MTTRPRAFGPVGAVVALGLAAAVASAPLPDGRAEAGSVSTVITSSTPITWTDGEGRQLMVATSSNTSLTVARDTLEGDPDPTWGPNGVRTVSFTLPPGAATTSVRIAADDSGLLTLVHAAASCSGSEPCDRWFQQIDGATGATASGPVAVADLPPPWKALDDGSLLLGAAGTPLVWFGPDGSERALTSVLTTDLIHADVDDAGRLLLLDDTMTVHRYMPGGGPVIDIDTPCDPVTASAPYAAVGASSHAAGFVVACGVAPNGTEVYRFGDDGSFAWSLGGGQAAGAPSGQVTDATVTPDGRVWVATTASSLFPWIPDGRGAVRVTAASSGGWEPPAYERTTGGAGYADLSGTGIVEMRPVGTGDEVALADLKVCCRYPNNQSPQMGAISAIVPSRPGPPLGRPGTPSLTSTPAGDLTVSFAGSPTISNRTNRRPTAYRVDATAGGATTSVTVADLGPGAAVDATLAGIGLGTLVQVAITPVNDRGDGLDGPSTGATITPFRSIDDFVDHQARTLAGRPLSSSDRAAYVASLAAGGQSSASVMEELITSGGAPIESIEPTARIYRAAFLRDADIGGLRYWYARHRSGTRIVAIAEQFAGSSEFQRRYGKLSDRRFVEQVYRNVLGRPGDPTGIDFWTRRLDAGRATRGTVLAGFSESGEFVRKTQGYVQPLAVTFLMLDRRPTAAEKATWSTAEAVYADFPAAVLATSDYAERILGR